jgi:hypothetical protein
VVVADIGGTFTMERGAIFGNTSRYGNNLRVKGNSGGLACWAAGSTGYVGSPDSGGRIAATPDTVDVDMWDPVAGTNGGHAVTGYNYHAKDYGIDAGMWAEKP